MPESFKAVPLAMPNVRYRGKADMRWCGANVCFWPKADIPLPLHGMAWTLLGHLVLNEPNDCCDSCPGDAAANCLTQDWVMSAFAVTADINSPGISQKL